MLKIQQFKYNSKYHYQYRVYNQFNKQFILNLIVERSNLTDSWIYLIGSPSICISSMEVYCEIVITRNNENNHYKVAAKISDQGNGSKIYEHNYGRKSDVMLYIYQKIKTFALLTGTYKECQKF